MTTGSAVLPLSARAARMGLGVVAAARWPEPGDEEAPKLAGFVHSTFNPIIAAVAGRCLRRRAESALPDGERRAEPPVTALVLVSPLGDVASAVHVAEAVDTGARVGPLFFFQSVPNAVLGHVAARWQLTGPVVCVAGTGSGLRIARGLLADGDADEALVIDLEQAVTGSEPNCTSEAAAAVLVVDGGPL